GERVVKRGKFGETAYLGQFYSVQDGTQATKHIFAGATRIASKLDKAPKDPPPGGTTPGNGNPGHLVGIARACEMGLGEKVGLLPRCPPPIGGGPSDGASLGPKPATYWYHPDHLGSVTYISTEKGDVYQHLEYFPYGDTW